MTVGRVTMALPHEIRELADRVTGRLVEARDFYLHTQQAWRVVQKFAHEGRSVGIVDDVTGQDLAASDLEAISQRYVAVHLAESVFKGLSGFLEDWIMGLARLWLTAFPVQLDSAFNEATERSRSLRRDEIQVPLSEILAAPDREAILGSVIERVIRELAYKGPAHWFRFIDNRVNLGCPDEAQRAFLCEVKAARDTLEHNCGVVGPDYVLKAGVLARFRVGDLLQIDEPYLLQCFAALQEVIATMADAAIRRSTGTPPS